MPVDNIPGMKEFGRKLKRQKRDEETDNSGYFKTILSQMKSHNSGKLLAPRLLFAVIYSSRLATAWPFQRPVSEDEAPDYYDHIKYPMDLKTMTERFKNKYYVNKRLFIADMLRIFSNCRAYNNPDTEYVKCANALEKSFINKMKESGLWDRG